MQFFNDEVSFVVTGASAIALSKPIEKFGGKLTPALHAKLMGRQPEDWSRIVSVVVDPLH